MIKIIISFGKFGKMATKKLNLSQALSTQKLNMTKFIPIWQIIKEEIF